LDSKEHKDVSALYELFFQFQENIDQRFKDWGCEQDTGDKNPCAEPVYAKYMLVTCPEYQNFPESEYAKFFQNMLNNVSIISQPSILWGCSKSTDSLRPQYPPSANAQYFLKFPTKVIGRY